ncbi:MAG: hypothetical protein QM703_08455 [Gemmatales bacterium]
MLIDALEKIEVDPGVYNNEIGSLATLRTGLLFLANQIRGRELEYVRQKPKNTFANFWGTDFDGTKDLLPQITCYFHWFAVSVCNYARLAGFIRCIEKNEFSRADLSDPTKFKAISTAIGNYVKGVSELTEVVRWRNKVASHYALTDPRPDDNIATLGMSTISWVAFDSGRYVSTNMTMITGNSTTGHSTSEIPQWSVTEVFQSLIPRYWPNTIKPQSSP